MLDIPAPGMPSGRVWRQFEDDPRATWQDSAGLILAQEALAPDHSGDPGVRDTGMAERPVSFSASLFGVLRYARYQEAAWMPNSLLELEAERSRILRQLPILGDLRTGPICAVPCRRGKPTCRCAKPNDPGHDPQVRLTRKAGGRTVAESFPSPSAGRKARAEIDEYHRFRKLSAELIAINEKIGRQRPLEPDSDARTPEEKNGCRGLRRRHPRNIPVAEHPVS